MSLGARDGEGVEREEMFGEALRGRHSVQRSAWPWPRVPVGNVKVRLDRHMKPRRSDRYLKRESWGLWTLSHN